MNELSQNGPALVISPHLDDAVLSCGQLILHRPGSTILTVLAGFPSGAHAGWSGQSTGMPIARDANLKRREEDQNAARALGARTVWVDIYAQEYESATSPSERLGRIKEAVDHAVATTDARSVFVPLGVTHPDHIVVSDAGLLAVTSLTAESYVYMDMPYGQARPGQVRRRLRHIKKSFRVDPLAPFNGDLQAKAKAVNAYDSQVGALRQGFGNRFDRVFVDPEKYWRVQPRV